MYLHNIKPIIMQNRLLWLLIIFLGSAAFHNASAGHIALQDHGGEAWFKNIEIRKL
jgi:hypothetical protein